MLASERMAEASVFYRIRCADEGDIADAGGVVDLIRDLQELVN